MMKYFCDFCSQEIAPLSTMSLRPIATIEFINSAPEKQITQMCCPDCATKLKEFLGKIKEENKTVNLGKDLTM